jgi:hypothetical protein
MWHIREYSDTALRNLIGMRFSNVTIKKMGGRPDVIAIETKRTKWLRWLLLPQTLLFLPDSFRISGLKAVQRVGRRLLPILSRQLTQTRPASAQAVTFSFDASDLWISDHANPSVNLIALAYREPI